MATAARRDTVWVGFVGEIPFIGSSKTLVEMGMAQYVGNYELAQEKSKALPGFSEPWEIETLMKYKEGWRLPEIPEGEKEAALALGLQEIKEVSSDDVDYVRRVRASKKKTPSPKAGEKRKREKVQETQEEALKKDPTPHT